MRRYNDHLAIYDEEDVVDALDAICEGGNETLTWQGLKCWKNPLDLMIYQEIVYRVRPTLIVETGTHAGGSAAFWRDMMALNDLQQNVVTVDVRRHPDLVYVGGVTYLEGSSTDDAIFDLIHTRVGDHKVLVNLDSDHSPRHVARELEMYAALVTPGSYVIVEDGVDDYRWEREGPHSATEAFLERHPEFEADTYRERLGFTNCPGGFLRRL